MLVRGAKQDFYTDSPVSFRDRMTTDRGCKVDFVIDRYDVSAPKSGYSSLDEYLVARWTGTEGESAGYQQLTEWFNKRLLKHVYEQNGRETIGTRIDSEYRALKGDDELLREEVIDDLGSDGIAAGSLVDDMVSWSTMRRHLKSCLEAEKPTPSSRSDWELESINIARDQTEEKTVAALRSLANKQRLPEAHKANVTVQVKLSCPECPTRIPLEDALARGYVCKDHFETTLPPTTGGPSAKSE